MLRSDAIAEQRTKCNSTNDEINKTGKVYWFCRINDKRFEEWNTFSEKRNKKKWYLLSGRNEILRKQHGSNLENQMNNEDKDYIYLQTFTNLDKHSNSNFTHFDDEIIIPSNSNKELISVIIWKQIQMQILYTTPMQVYRNYHIARVAKILLSVLRNSKARVNDLPKQKRSQVYSRKVTSILRRKQRKFKIKDNTINYVWRREIISKLKNSHKVLCSFFLIRKGEIYELLRKAFYQIN